MNNLDKYNKAFTNTFNVEAAMLDDGFAYRSVSVWDSVAHMELISAIEDSFDIMLDTEDILGFTSYSEGKKILSKYDIDL